jgi:alkylresorcinol/alkylpyrone synthase
MADVLITGEGLKLADIRHFVLHSAGRRVIDQARKLLDLTDEQVAASRHVLRHFGNMSSATVVFVLDEVLRGANVFPGDWGLMIALGPGFAAEGALLRW